MAKSARLIVVNGESYQWAVKPSKKDPRKINLGIYRKRDREYRQAVLETSYLNEDLQHYDTEITPDKVRYYIKTLF